MEIDANDLIRAIEAQRNAALNEAAQLKAAFDGATRQLEAAHKQIAEWSNKKAKG